MSDDRNVCQLYTDRFIVIQKGKTHNFDNHQLKTVAIKHKKLLFPLVAGGIIGTFFFVAAFNFLFNLWLSLSISGIGFIAMYLGWHGTATLSISTSVKEYDFFLHATSPPLHAFCEFVRENIVYGNPKSIQFYIPLSDGQATSSKPYDQLGSNVKTYLLSERQFKMGGFTKGVVINILESDIEINIDYDEETRSFSPYIDPSTDLSDAEIINLS